jgi:hypothetical protein
MNKINNDMTVREKIDFIFSNNYHPFCHPSRVDDMKAQHAIELLADEITKMWQVFKAY